MSPIENLTIQKVAESRLQIRFDYVHVNDDFDAALVLVVEQDHRPESFELRSRPYVIQTPGGSMNTTHLDFFNTDYDRWWNEGSTAGPRDDVGNRRFMRRLRQPLGADTDRFIAFYNPHQPDEQQTSSRPHGLEFYCWVGIVARINGRAVAQLGDLMPSNQISGV